MRHSCGKMYRIFQIRRQAALYPGKELVDKSFAKALPVLTKCFVLL
jgi:hypothetical protein